MKYGKDKKPHYRKNDEVTLDEKVLSLYDNITEMVREITTFYLYGVMDER